MLLVLIQCIAGTNTVLVLRQSVAGTNTVLVLRQNVAGNNTVLVLIYEVFFCFQDNGAQSQMDTSGNRSPYFYQQNK